MKTIALKDKNHPIIIFIFDQFKQKNANKDIYLEIENFIKKEKYFKLIISSSLNDEDIRKEYKSTIFKYKGNPKELNAITQYYYFYFINLFKNKKNIGHNDKFYLLYKLFDFKAKYINLFKNVKERKYKDEINCFNLFSISIRKKIVNEINNKIDTKLKEFYSSNNYTENLEFNMAESLIIILNIINKKLLYDELNYYVDFIPFKYFNLKYYKDNFKIKCSFNYIKIYLEKK